MIDLDQPQLLRGVDVADALGITAGSADQWTGARGTPLLTPQISSILTVGMGASGFAGELLAGVAHARLPVPVVVHKDADLPAFVGPGTLVFAVSYSGTTEETCAAAARAVEAGAHVVGITSGGALAEQLAAAGRPVLTVPSGHQPRHTVGWLAAAMLTSCGLADELPDAAEAARRMAADCAHDVPTVRNPAKRLASTIADTDVVIGWGTSRIAAVLVQRLASQLNEHTKLPAYRSLLPELAHNEVVGWGGPESTTIQRGLVLVRDPDGETPAARDRVVPAVDQVRHRFSWVESFSTASGPALARYAALSMLFDLATVYAAIARGVDPTPIQGIDALKAALAAARERSAT